MIKYNPLVLDFDTPQELHCVLLPQNTIVVLEGMPGTGKTSILLTLAEEFEGDYIVLSEMNLEPHSSKKNLPPEEQKNIFHQLWIERMRLLEAYKRSGLCFLLDRSYFSNLAYIYALDSINETSYYPLYRKDFEKSFSNSSINLMFVLDVAPETSLKRRQLRGDNIPWPWSNLAFLKTIRKFYKEELPKFSKIKIKYINAEKEEHNTTNEVMVELRKLIDKKNNFFPSFIAPNKKQLKTLFDFAERKQLGRKCTRLINVLGNPTLYFLKHSIQLERGQPVFFNNTQLYKILDRYTSLGKIINE